MTKCRAGSVPMSAEFHLNIQIHVSCADLLPCERLSCNKVSATGKQRFN